ncbi:variant leucine-rich repeat-containing protein [Brachybacterium paraconglomeratum]|uniref:variant leucine-rich repeat-containing protein n=1 Tax=Brachybacterium paraconglomeratum TaxID=173362 RepID=UPI003FD5AFF4
MAEHRSTAEEAADPGTSPERLLELTEKHPQLHRLIVMNPSAPEVARQWILATNQWAKQAYEAGTLQPDEDGAAETAGVPEGGSTGASTVGTAPAPAGPASGDAPSDGNDDLDEGEPTQLHQVVPDEDQAPEESAWTAAPQAEADDSASAWEEVPEELVWGTAAGATGAAAAGAVGAGTDASAGERPGTTPPPAPPAQQAPVGGPAPDAQPSPSAQGPTEGTSSVRLSPKASVVPLGAAPAAQTSPSAQASPASQASPAPQAGPPTRQMPAVAASAAATGAAASAAQHPTAAQGPSGQQQYPYGEQAPASPGPASQGPASAPPPVGRPPQDEDDSDDGSRKRALIACGGCLVLALILLLVIGLGARALFAPDEEQYQRDSSTTSAEAAPEETTEETTEDPVSPAPEGAEEMSELRSPTGNISCHLEEDSVSCSLVERDFSEAGLEDCENGPFSITVAGEDAERACGTSFLSDSAPTLEYDRSAQRGDVACTSRFDGMTCWNVMTGKGFTVNKVSYETF